MNVIFIIIYILISLLLPYRLGISPELILAFPFALIMVLATFTDIKSHIIPDRLIYPGIILLFLLRLFIHPLPLWEYIAGAFLGGGLLLIVSLVSKGGVGGGDIKLFFLAGLVLGWKGTLLALFLSVMSGGVVAAVLLLTGRVNRKDRIPFAPFILIGTLSAYLFGEEITGAYIRLFL